MIEVAGSPVKALIDTGASVNVMGVQQYRRLQPRPRLAPSSTKIFTYGSRKPLPLKGRMAVTVQADGRTIATTFHVVDREADTLLGSQAAEELGLVTFARCIPLCQINYILREFPELFAGLGCLKAAPIKLHVDKAVKPVALRHRRIPFHLGPLVEQELANLEEQGVIEKVSGPTPWVSPMVIAEKPKQPGKNCLCFDMRLPNQAIKRERHITPTIDDIISDLNGSRWFSKLDLNAGYHQLQLVEESRYITTFSTHLGLQAPEIRCIIGSGGIPRCHSTNLVRLTKRNERKRRYTPQRPKTTISRFIPRLATLSEPLRALTKADAPWAWGSPEEEAFQELKKALLCDTTMAYFDPVKKTKLTIDASPVGLGQCWPKKANQVGGLL
ncbi:hypothetical protein NDU88_008107 [Pleurodeles waltl]|uniref:Reverse transcriptase/retrotransposon-derived protein RNase H-like domain-containing protein n=1 Tax=Pleurodeles waltl TaxID=8319 RepID=A0AAV7VU50_PLEWA|nr:hypothetical protein NDU88_008107 [Pleurodeles waltl]